MADPLQKLRADDALILVDIQRCFCPGGTLAVSECDNLVRLLNRWVAAAREKGVPIYASRDWHPKNHPSFSNQGGEWPPHCIQDTSEAGFHPDLQLPEEVTVVTKGTRFDQDQNSIFDQTGLDRQLKRQGVKRIWIGGLALDVCVLASVLDARSAGFEVRVLQNATRPVTEQGGREALGKMTAAGAEIAEA